MLQQDLPVRHNIDVIMDENSGRHRYATADLSAVAPVAAATSATGPLRGEKIFYFSKFFKMHNKTYFFSSSLQITFLHNSSTLLCLKEHQKAHDLAELQSIHRVLL